MFIKMEVDRRNRRLKDARDKRMLKKTEKSVEAEASVDELHNVASEQCREVKNVAEQPEVTGTPKLAKPQGIADRNVAIAPEKKAAIASLVGSLLQARADSSS